MSAPPPHTSRLGQSPGPDPAPNRSYATSARPAAGSTAPESSARSSRAGRPREGQSRGGQAREGQSRARRWLGQFHLYGAFWYRCHLEGMRYVPRFLIPVLLRILVILSMILLPKIRRAIEANQEAVHGPCGRLERYRRVWRNLLTFGWCLTERNEELGLGREITPEVEGEEHWKAVAEHGGGFVLVTAHVGHWEVGSAYPSDLQGRKIHVVREAEIDPDAQAYFHRKLLERGREFYTVHFASRAASLGPKLLLALRDGDIVALQGDRPAKGGRAIEVKLFGRPFRVPAGPAAMARTADVPLLPVFVYRTGRRRSRLVFRPPSWPEKTADRQADLRRIAEHMTSEVEQAIRRAPEQWFCFENLWPRTSSHSDSGSTRAQGSARGEA